MNNLDSPASLKALNNTSISSRLVLDIAYQLNTLGTSHQVEPWWVPGHKRVYCNELAEELARERSSINNTIKEYLFKVHLNNYKQVPLSDKGKIPLELFLNKYKYRNFKISGTHIRWLTWLL